MKPSTLIVGSIAVIAVAGSLLWLRALNNSAPSASSIPQHAGCGQVSHAFVQHQSSVWLTLSAPVARTLTDSIGQFDHQRFILRCPSGQTVLIENDVSIGRRVPVRRGDLVIVHGQYIWNSLGGLVHYTHHGGGAESGWIALKGEIYALLHTRLILL